jgi:hypothetical protein
MTLNWILATEQEYTDAHITPQPTATRFILDTPQGEQEVILQHVDIHAEDFEILVRKMPSDNFLSDASLQYLLPRETEETPKQK